MLRRVPTTSVPLKIRDIGYAAFVSAYRGDAIKGFEAHLARYFGCRYAFTVNSGTTAFYVILKALKKFSSRKEVILPAYTVPTITLAVNEAGLRTRLTDVSLDTLNMDPVSLKEVITDDTLCVMPAHMFGFPCKIKDIQDVIRGKDVFLVEDGAQAPGAEIGGLMVGTIGDAGFFSLCKGKNISTFTGGIITTNDPMLSEDIEKEIAGLRKRKGLENLILPFSLFAYSMAMRPFIYGPAYAFIKGFKSTQLHQNFNPMSFHRLQASLGSRLFKRLDAFNLQREERGTAMYNKLKDIRWLSLPEIPEEGKVVFNHLPVVFHDSDRMDHIINRLWRRGIDTARMYLKPIHRIYPLGYPLDPDPFPQASYIAPRLVTLPTHPYMRERDIDIIVKTFEEM